MHGSKYECDYLCDRLHWIEPTYQAHPPKVPAGNWLSAFDSHSDTHKDAAMLQLLGTGHVTCTLGPRTGHSTSKTSSAGPGLLTAGWRPNDAADTTGNDAANQNILV